MKKILIVTFFVLFSLVIVGCGNVPSLTTTAAATTSSNQVTTAATTQEVTTASDTTLNQITTSPVTTTTSEYTGEGVNCFANPDDPACSFSGNIVLSYADWGDQELNAILIAAFEEKYPNITVDLRQDITGSGAEFTGNLINAQAANLLPDVFAIDNVPTGISQGMLLDVAQYWDTDPDTQLIYPNIAATAVYNGMRLAMPSFMFIKGIYVNKTLLATYNIYQDSNNVPPYDWNYDEFIDSATQVRQAGKNDYVYGIDPWYGALDFETTFPMEDYVDVGYNTWDGSQFNFTSQDWIDAYNTKLDLVNQKVVASYTPEDLEALGGAQFWPWYEGLISYKIDGSWNLWMVDQMWDEKGIDVGFWPYPGGAAGQFPPTILDYVCVSSQTAHPFQAYLLAKWMTWGREGWQARLDAMYDRGDLYLDRYPIADYPDIWTEADDFIDYIDGLRQSIELLPYSKPDVDKWLPGYKQFWEWVGNDENDYWNRINEGLVTPEVFAGEWETKINQMVNDAMNSIGTE